MRCISWIKTPTVLAHLADGGSLGRGRYRWGLSLRRGRWPRCRFCRRSVRWRSWYVGTSNHSKCRWVVVRWMLIVRSCSSISRRWWWGPWGVVLRGRLIAFKDYESIAELKLSVLFVRPMIDRLQELRSVRCCLDSQRRWWGVPRLRMTSITKRSMRNRRVHRTKSIRNSSKRSNRFEVWLPDSTLTTNASRHWSTAMRRPLSLPSSDRAASKWTRFCNRMPATKTGLRLSWRT
jgi:hypothetical protein